MQYKRDRTSSFCGRGVDGAAKSRLFALAHLAVALEGSPLLQSAEVIACKYAVHGLTIEVQSNSDDTAWGALGGNMRGGTDVRNTSGLYAAQHALSRLIYRGARHANRLRLGVSGDEERIGGENSGVCGLSQAKPRRPTHHDTVEQFHTETSKLRTIYNCKKEGTRGAASGAGVSGASTRMSRIYSQIFSTQKKGKNKNRCRQYADESRVALGVGVVGDCYMRS